MNARCDQFDFMMWKYTICLTNQYKSCTQCPQNINCELADIETRYNNIMVFYAEGENI